MTGTVEKRLAELNIELPKPAAPVASYVPYVVTGNLVFVAGQGPMWNGEIKFQGRVGEVRSLEEGRAAARMCGLNILAHVKEACGSDLDRITRCVKLGGFVSCADGFTDHPKVINGASDLMIDVFGDKGRHARFAVGAPALPLDISVEVDAIFEIA